MSAAPVSPRRAGASPAPARSPWPSATSITGYVRASWAHYFQRDAGLSASLIGLPGASFAIEGAKPARNAALLATGFDVRLTPSVTLGARLDGEFSDRANRVGGSAQLRGSF